MHNPVHQGVEDLESVTLATLDLGLDFQVALVFT
jgi:hypothetical protein